MDLRDDMPAELRFKQRRRIDMSRDDSEDPMPQYTELMASTQHRIDRRNTWKAPQNCWLNNAARSSS